MENKDLYIVHFCLLLLVLMLHTIIGAKYMGARVLEYPLKIFIGISSERGKAPHDYSTLV
jgi:hypothetical protein